MKNQTLALIRADPLRCECLSALHELALPQGMICAGFVRNLIWDTVHERALATPLADVDVVWFDFQANAPAIDLELELQLQKRLPNVRWQVRNQARMHQRNGVAAYRSAVDAVQRFPETATCLAVSLQPQLQLDVESGLRDAWALRLQHNVHSGLAMQVSAQRIREKNWQAHWPRLQIENELLYL